MTQPFPTLPPGRAGVAPELAEKLDAGIRSGLLRHLHAVAVLRAGVVVLEQY
jgi:hypothetical protein